MTTQQIAWNFRVYDAMLATKDRAMRSFAPSSWALANAVFDLWHAMRDIHAAQGGER